MAHTSNCLADKVCTHVLCRLHMCKIILTTRLTLSARRALGLILLGTRGTLELAGKETDLLLLSVAQAHVCLNNKGRGPQEYHCQAGRQATDSEHARQGCLWEHTPPSNYIPGLPSGRLENVVRPDDDDDDRVLGDMQSHTVHVRKGGGGKMRNFSQVVTSTAPYAVFRCSM